jgi:hypothetical protein
VYGPWAKLAVVAMVERRKINNLRGFSRGREFESHPGHHPRDGDNAGFRGTLESRGERPAHWTVYHMDGSSALILKYLQTDWLNSS